MQDNLGQDLVRASWPADDLFVLIGSFLVKSLVMLVKKLISRCSSVEVSPSILKDLDEQTGGSGLRCVSVLTRKGKFLDSCHLTLLSSPSYRIFVSLCLRCWKSAQTGTLEYKSHWLRFEEGASSSLSFFFEEKIRLLEKDLLLWWIASWWKRTVRFCEGFHFCDLIWCFQENLLRFLFSFGSMLMMVSNYGRVWASLIKECTFCIVAIYFCHLDVSPKSKQFYFHGGALSRTWRIAYCNAVAISKLGRAIHDLTWLICDSPTTLINATG